MPLTKSVIVRSGSDEAIQKSTIFWIASFLTMTLFCNILMTSLYPPHRHCEERSDEAIQKSTIFWIASFLAMTLFANNLIYT
jgi:preprotein translocase subunit SecG